MSNGTLTADQASELQSFFAQGGPQASADGSSEGSTDMAVEGTGAACGPRGPGGPPPPPSDEEADDSTTTSTATSTDSDTQLSAMDQLNSLISFLENLRTSMASNTYGSSTTTADNSGLLVDIQA
ncbi:hypothetical protein BH10PSE12_BH10PSE12_05240 [soil metagenome]